MPTLHVIHAHMSTLKVTANVASELGSTKGQESLEMFQSASLISIMDSNSQRGECVKELNILEYWSVRKTP